MKKQTINIAILLTILLSFSTLAAAPRVKIEKEYYTVSGSTAREIRNDMNKKTPVKENDEKFDARTSWFVHWKYYWNESDDKCSITQVTTEIDVHFILPKLTLAAPLPQALMKRWQEYFIALLRHENGHKDIGVQAASEIEERIRAMKPRMTCKQLELDANSLGHKIIYHHRSIEKKFDRKTNHGMNEGAIFP